MIVLPKTLATSFDGASFALRRRIVFVAEHQADAVLHELGHDDDKVFYRMDIMGRIGPAWAGPETVGGCRRWTLGW